MKLLHRGLAALCALLVLNAAPALAANGPTYVDQNGIGRPAQGVFVVPPTSTADEVVLGQVGGAAQTVTATFTTPAGTTAYAIGDLIANSATAGSVVSMSFTAARANDKTGMIRRVRVKTTDTGFAGASVRVHLYKANPTYTNGDNGVWLTTESTAFCDLDVTMGRHYSDAEKGIGVPIEGSECNFEPAAGTQLIYGNVEARSAATPQGSKLWTITAEVLQN